MARPADTLGGGNAARRRPKEGILRVNEHDKDGFISSEATPSKRQRWSGTTGATSNGEAHGSNGKPEVDGLKGGYAGGGVRKHHPKGDAPWKHVLAKAFTAANVCTC